jgi:uncharacterized membrane protein YgcG
LNTKELVLVFIFVIIVLCTLPTNYMIRGQVPANDIKITSPNKGEVVPVGNLTIHGTSSDNANSDCQVYVDWNNLKPFQNASPTGAAGANDYSNWTFTYTNDYHLITKGSNELTANLFCLDNPSAAAYSSINIIGQSPKISDTGSKSDTGTRQYSGDDSGRDSREDPFKFVRFCVIVEDYSNGDDQSGDDQSGSGSSGGDPGSSGGDTSSSGGDTSSSGGDTSSSGGDQKKDDQKKDDQKKNDQKKNDENGDSEDVKIRDKGKKGFEDDIERVIQERIDAGEEFVTVCPND